MLNHSSTSQQLIFKKIIDAVMNDLSTFYFSIKVANSGEYGGYQPYQNVQIIKAPDCSCGYYYIVNYTDVADALFSFHISDVFKIEFFPTYYNGNKLTCTITLHDERKVNSPSVSNINGSDKNDAGLEDFNKFLETLRTLGLTAFNIVGERYDVVEPNKKDHTFTYLSEEVDVNQLYDLSEHCKGKSNRKEGVVYLDDGVEIDLLDGLNTKSPVFNQVKQLIITAAERLNKMYKEGGGVKFDPAVFNDIISGQPTDVVVTFLEQLMGVIGKFI